MSDPYDGQSSTQDVPGVSGTNTAEGDGVFGSGRRGVVGESDTFQGVFGKSRDNAGIVGESANFHAVFGISHDVHNAGVFGANDAGGFGVIGTCDANIGVAGDSKTGIGVRGTSQTGDGVFGTGRRGVVGVSPDFQGVYGHSTNNFGVVGESTNSDGVSGFTHNKERAAVSGHNTAGGMAGFFEGSVTVIGAFHHNGNCIHDGKVTHNGNVDTHGTHTVTGDVVLTNGDCAEEFNIAESVEVEPGTVMVLDQDGALQPSQQAYDKRVAGVISGAGDYKPAIVLDKQQSSEHRVPVALVGKVYCKVDACYASIEVGDLLTTSPTAGHAMKASDHLKAFGAVIGKALRPLKEGQSLIPILIALQ